VQAVQARAAAACRQISGRPKVGARLWVASRFHQREPSQGGPCCDQAMHTEGRPVACVPRHAGAELLCGARSGDSLCARRGPWASSRDRCARARPAGACTNTALIRSLTGAACRRGLCYGTVDDAYDTALEKLRKRAPAGARAGSLCFTSSLSLCTAPSLSLCTTPSLSLCPAPSLSLCPTSRSPLSC
jgi:hypothetical protein